MNSDILNREKGAAPLYFQLAAILKTKIENGEYEYGDIFPTELQLQEKYNLSRITVRQAISKLTNEGYLKCARGIGTKVIFTKIDESLRQVISFSEEMSQHNINMTTSFCEISLVHATKHIAMQLNEDPDSNIYRLERVRCANDEPIVYSVTYMSGSRNLPLDSSKYYNSLYKLLNDEFNLIIAKGKETYEAVLADINIANMLDISIGMPIIKRTRKTYDMDDKIIEYTVCYYAGNKYKYSIEL